MPRTALTKTIWISVALSLITLAALALVPPHTWDIMTPATCLPSGCFCEAINPAHSIRQPANTVSSLLFLLVGVWALLSVWQNTHRGAFKPTHQIIFGLSVIVTAIGSAFYHASMTFTGQFFDILGMYLLTSLMWVYAMQRLGRWPMWVALIVYIALNFGLTFVQVNLPETRRFIFALVLMLALMTEGLVWSRLHPPRKYRWFWGGLLTFGGAYTVWMLDDSGAWCESASWLQGHAIWHGLCAVAIFALWRWYISEDMPDNP